MALRLCWCQATFKNKEHRFIEVCIKRTHSEMCIASKKKTPKNNKEITIVALSYNSCFFVKLILGLLSKKNNENYNAFVQSW